MARRRAARGGDRARAGSSSRRACPCTREYLAGDVGRPAVLPTALRAADALGLAREDDWRPGEPGAVPFVVARDALPLDTAGGELGEDELVRLFRARGEERQRVFAAADRLRREVCGDEVTYVVTRNIQYTNVCYFRCGFCAFSKGKLAANLRGRAVPRPARGDRPPRPGGLGARRDRGLPAGRHPSGVHRRLLRLASSTRSGRELPGLHVHAFSALEVWQGAATLGLPLEEYLDAAARRSASARCRAPPPRSSTTRCARSSARTRSRPSSGSRCTTPRTGSGCART